MRRVLWLILVATVVVAATWYLSGLPGEVSLHVAGYTIASKTPIALIAAALAVLILYATLRLLGALLHLPRNWKRWRAARHRASGDAATSRTLVALAAGDAPAARKNARQALRWLGETPQTLLHAAESERLAGRDDAAAGYFRQLAARPDGAFLGLRGLFRLAVARGAWDEAALLASQAEALQPGKTWLADTRLMLAARQHNWTQAAALAAPGATHAALAIAAADATTDRGDALRLAKHAWTEAKSLAPAALAYAAALRTSGRERQALDIVRETWTLAPHPDLVAFVIAPGADATARLKRFTAFAQPHADAAEAQFALARLSLDADAPGDATYHLEAAERAGLTDRRAALLRADIARASFQPDAERKALRDASNAPAPPGWQCQACGVAHGAWHVRCEACEAVGRIGWSSAGQNMLQLK